MRSAEIYRSDPPRRRECLYYLSLGHYKMGNYDEARRFNALLIEREPNNLQAQSLNHLIEKGVARGKCPLFQFSMPTSGTLDLHSNIFPASRSRFYCRGLHWHGIDRRSCRGGKYRRCRFDASRPPLDSPTTTLSCSTHFLHPAPFKAYLYCILLPSLQLTRLRIPRRTLIFSQIGRAHV